MLEMAGNCLICLKTAGIAGDANGNDDKNDNYDGEESNGMA